MSKAKPDLEVLLAVRVKVFANPQGDIGQPEEFTAKGVRYARNHVAAFMRDACRSWGGQYPPDHPMHPDNISVTVSVVRDANSERQR
jgi:hypothetical protein